MKIRKSYRFTHCTMEKLRSLAELLPDWTETEILETAIGEFETMIAKKYAEKFMGGKWNEAANNS